MRSLLALRPRARSFASWRRSWVSSARRCVVVAGQLFMAHHLQYGSDVAPVELEEVLEAEAESLRAEREQRLQVVIDIENKLQKLRGTLGLQPSPEDLNLSAESNITTSGMKSLTLRLKDLEAVLREKRERASKLVTSINEYWLALDMAPTTRLEQTIAAGLDAIELSDETLHVMGNMHAMVRSRSACFIDVTQW